MTKKRGIVIVLWGYSPHLKTTTHKAISRLKRQRTRAISRSQRTESDELPQRDKQHTAARLMPQVDSESAPLSFGHQKP